MRDLKFRKGGLLSLLLAATPIPSHAPWLPGPEHDLWIAPRAASTLTSGDQRRQQSVALSLSTYLDLVDRTGRIVRAGKRGAIPAHLAPILEREGEFGTDTHLTHPFPFFPHCPSPPLTTPARSIITRMTVARSHLVNPTRAGAYHLVNRCVRRGFLCGDRWEYRRQWVHDHVREHAALFAIDILAYAVMANHFHLVAVTHPERCAAWSAQEGAERWSAVFPRRAVDGSPLPADPAEIARRATDAAWVDKQRGRLSSISWFMKVMKERIARRANREDGCTGSFWQGRFTSVALLDQGAVIACMAYVDLNPIRAKVAETPESSLLTSIHDRIAARQSHRIAQEINNRTATVDAATPPLGGDVAIPGPGQGLWIAPVAACTPTSEAVRTLAPFPLSPDTYLELVDETGRIVRSGKRGAIPAHLAPILERLEIDAQAWVDIMMRGGSFLGSAIGSAVARAGEAMRRGMRWLVDRLGLHRKPASMA